MKLGAVFPTTEIGNDPSIIRDWAQAAEELGYDQIVTFDHVLGAEHADRKPRLGGPYTENDAFHEPFTLFSFLAAVTERVDLVTGVLIAPQRQTALVAKQAAEVDLLSRGRMRLGVGTGWNYIEYDSLGLPFKSRGAMLDEQVEVMRKLWTEELVDYEGRFHKIERANILPRPKRPIPIWFGAIAPVALDRAARLGDGLLLASAPSTIEPMVHKVRELLGKHGRDVASYPIETFVDFSHGPERWESELELWKKLEGTHISLRAMDTAAKYVGAEPVGYSGPQAYIDALATFKEHVRGML
jgi:probable F420-dependent oxidoreductase